MGDFKIIAKDGNARAGILTTGHGRIQTPVFMPVGTQASVKALTPDDLTECGTQIILGNTYHLYLRPGSKVIKKMGGLHQFMDWQGPILTDSGGFQAFSLGAMIEHGVRKIPHSKAKVFKAPLEEANMLDDRMIPSKITEEGVLFSSHLDGSMHLLTPEKSIQIQLDLGSDIVLVLDELLSPLHDREYVESSLARTHRWEERSKQYFDQNKKLGTNNNPQLFGIVQGVYDKDIRLKAASWVAEQDFDGISIGGSFGVSPFYGGNETNWTAIQALKDTLDWVIPILPDKWPRHILGIGEVHDFFECIERGADMFDCVAPTRRARNGSLYISPQNGGNLDNKFTLSIQRSQYLLDTAPIDPGCDCYTCDHFSRSYLRHLYMAKEILYHRLATIHNIYFMLNLVKKIRNSILDEKYQELKKLWVK